MPPRSFLTGLSFALVAATAALAEQHTIRFENHCGFGTPQLIIGGKLLSHGEDYVHQGPLSAGIAYLQTGKCLFNGENCTLMEMTLANPTCIGCASSADISLIPSHAFSVTTGFEYYNGCDGRGAVCTHPTCNTAFFVPDDNQVQVQCNEADVNLLITFCKADTATGGGGGSGGDKPQTTKAPPPPPTTNKAPPPPPTTTKAAPPPPFPSSSPSSSERPPPPAPTTATSSSSSSKAPAPMSSAPATLPTSPVNRESCQRAGVHQVRRRHHRRAERMHGNAGRL